MGKGSETAKVKQIWKESRPAYGTIGERFMHRLGFCSVTMPASLQFHSKLWCAELKKPMPALVCGVFRGGFIRAVHCTFLRTDGRGVAKVKRPSMVVGECSGGLAMLGIAQGGTLVLTDKLSTAFAIKRARPMMSVCASLEPSNMHAKVPHDVRKLIICAGDKPRQELERLAAAHAAPSRTVQIARVSQLQGLGV